MPDCVEWIMEHPPDLPWGCLELGGREISLAAKRAHHGQRRGFPYWAKHTLPLLLLSQPVYLAADSYGLSMAFANPAGMSFVSICFLCKWLPRGGSCTTLPNNAYEALSVIILYLGVIYDSFSWDVVSCHGINQTQHKDANAIYALNTTTKMMIKLLLSLWKHIVQWK